MTSETPLATLMLAADPQFGMYRAQLDLAVRQRDRLAEAGGTDPIFEGLPDITFERETLLARETIEAANALKPDALIVCGDMVNDIENEQQRGLALAMADALDAGIELLWVSGNHDVAPNTYDPTEEALDQYRTTFGEDRYTRSLQGVRLIVINSTAIHSDALPDERSANLAFLEAELGSARVNGEIPVVCSHHNWFLRTPDEEAENPARGMAIPRAPRRLLLDIAERGGLRTLLTGHMHQHLTRQTGSLEQITTSSIGMPLGPSPSGYRVIRVYADHVEHEKHSLPSGPALHQEAAQIWAARQFQTPLDLFA